MSASPATTFVRDPGKEITSEFLKSVLASHNKALGVALLNVDHLQVARLKDLDLDEEAIQNMLDTEQFKTPVLLVNIQSETKFEEDVGPFSMLENADGNPILVVALDGDFSDYAQEDTAHMPTAFAAQKLRSRIEKRFKACDQNIGKLMDELEQDEEFTEGIQRMFTGDRGSITFMSIPRPGEELPEFLHINVKDGDSTAGETSFGWVSNYIGTKTEAAPEKPKSLSSSMLDLLKGNPKRPTLANAEPPPRTAASPIASTTPLKVATNRPTLSLPSAGTAKSVPSVGSTAPAGQTTTADPKAVLSIPVPLHMQGDPKRMKKWLSQRVKGRWIEHVPNWQQIKTLTITRELATKKFMDDWAQKQGMAAVAEATVAQQTAPAPKVEAATTQKVHPAVARRRPTLETVPGTGPQPEVRTEPASKPAVTPSAPVPATEPKQDGVALRKDTSTHTVSNENKGIVEGPIAIIPPGPKQKIAAILESLDFKAGMDRQGQLIADPEKAKALENRIPSFANQFGFKSLSDLKNVAYSQWLKIGEQGGYQPLCVMIANLQTEARHMEKFVEELMAEIEDLKAKQPQTQNLHPAVKRRMAGGIAPAA